MEGGCCLGGLVALAKVNGYLPKMRRTKKEHRRLGEKIGAALICIRKYSSLLDLSSWCRPRHGRHTTSPPTITICVFITITTITVFKLVSFFHTPGTHSSQSPYTRSSARLHLCYRSFICMKMRAGFAEEYNVVHQTGTSCQEQRCSSCAVTEMDRCALEEEVAENFEGGRMSGDVLDLCQKGK